MFSQNSVLSDVQENQDRSTLNYRTKTIHKGANARTIDAESYSELIESKTNLKIIFMQNGNLIQQNSLLIKENHRLKKLNEKLAEERSQAREELARANEKIELLMSLMDSEKGEKWHH